MIKKNQGITLVELLVGIAIGSLVTIAATTVILMGLRLNRQSMDTAGKQNTARVLLTAMENMAADGSIAKVNMEYEDWQIVGEDDTIIYSYNAEKRVIYTGNSEKGKPFMKNVLSSYLEYENGLLTLSVETEKGIFNSTVFCRQAIAASGQSGSVLDKPTQEPVIDPQNPEVSTGVPNAEGRKAFLHILLSQYKVKTDDPNSPGTNPGGIILGFDENMVTKDYVGKYYSQWYIGDGWEKNGWNKNTPWCACYVTWGIAELVNAKDNNNQGYTKYTNDATNFRPTFAGVDSFLTHFYLKGTWINSSDYQLFLKDSSRGQPVYSGDVVFFDWVVNEERNPQHVGVVLFVKDEPVIENGVTQPVKFVYTIEGNLYDDGDWGSTVGIRKYRVDDPRILGYGVLDWKTDA